jgi:hypothetical protein
MKGHEMDEDARLARAYRARAMQIREEADQMTDQDIKRGLLNIAANYEQLAKAIAGRRISS